MRMLGLLLCCVMLIGCQTAPRPTVVAYGPSPAVVPTYSLAAEDELPREVRVPLTFENGYLFVEGSINGQSAGAMLFDTGSTLNIIDSGVVGRLELESIGEGRTVGIAGTQSFTAHRVDSLAIEELDLGVDRAASLSLLPLTRGIGVVTNGLIGSASLLPHPFAVDYGRGELIVYQRDRFTPSPQAQRLGLEFYGGLPAVRARLANGRAVLLIIDTGMGSALSLPASLADEPGILATGTTGASASRGVGGVIRTREGWLSSLEVFGYRLGGVPVSFEPMTREPRRTDLPVGRVGGEVLRGFRLTFDARYGVMWAEFSEPPTD